MSDKMPHTKKLKLPNLVIKMELICIHLPKFKVIGTPQPASQSAKADGSGKKRHFPHARTLQLDLVLAAKKSPELARTD